MIAGQMITGLANKEQPSRVLAEAAKLTTLEQKFDHFVSLEMTDKLVARLLNDVSLSTFSFNSFLFRLLVSHRDFMLYDNTIIMTYILYILTCGVQLSTKQWYRILYHPKLSLLIWEQEGTRPVTRKYIFEIYQI